MAHRLTTNVLSEGDWIYRKGCTDPLKGCMITMTDERSGAVKVFDNWETTHRYIFADELVNYYKV